MSRQAGVIGRLQAHSLGLSERRIEGLVNREEWVPLLPGVYGSAASARSWEQRLVAVSIWVGPDAVFCDRTAAYLHGFLEERPEVIEVCSARRLRPRPGVRVVRRALERGDVVKKGPFRLTHPSRTMVDLAAVLDEEDLEITLHAGASRKIVSLPRVARRIDGMETRGRKTLVLRRLVDVCPGRPPESPTETRTLRILRRIAPPLPETQFVVVLAGKRRRVDFAYPDRRKAVESDSYEFHIRPWDFERNLEKRALLRLAGWDVFAVSSLLVRDSAADAERQLHSFVHDQPFMDI